MRYGLNSKHINAINSVFKELPEVEKAFLYGSRAMPKASPLGKAITTTAPI